MGLATGISTKDVRCVVRHVTLPATSATVSTPALEYPEPLTNTQKASFPAPRRSASNGTDTLIGSERSDIANGASFWESERVTSGLTGITPPIIGASENAENSTRTSPEASLSLRSTAAGSEYAAGALPLLSTPAAHCRVSNLYRPTSASDALARIFNCCPGTSPSVASRTMCTIPPSTRMASDAFSYPDPTPAVSTFVYRPNAASAHAASTVLTEPPWSDKRSSASSIRRDRSSASM